MNFFIVVIFLVRQVQVSGGINELFPTVDDCLADSHIQCGELVVWEDTKSPASTILQLKFPRHVDVTAGWSVSLSTRHQNTTSSTTIKVSNIDSSSHPKTPS
jgi:hypothetical protein